MAARSHAQTWFHYPAQLLFTAMTLLVWFLFVALPAPAKPFPVETFSYYVNDYEFELRKLFRTVTKTDAEIEADITLAETVNNARLAAASIEQLLSRRPYDGALWLRLAQKLAVAAPINNQDESTLSSKTVGAGLRAYVLARNPPDEAAALAIAARGFAGQQLWRHALAAYRKSFELVEQPNVRQSYETMRIDHGFRVTDYKVETDTVPPRVCLELSDPVSRTVTDFSPYIKLEPGTVTAVTADSTRALRGRPEAWRALQGHRPEGPSCRR